MPKVDGFHDDYFPAGHPMLPAGGRRLVLRFDDGTDRTYYAQFPVPRPELGDDDPGAAPGFDVMPAAAP